MYQKYIKIDKKVEIDCPQVGVHISKAGVKNVKLLKINI